EDFIRRFADSFYASLARARLEELRKQRIAALPPPAPPPPPSPQPSAAPSFRVGGDIVGAGATYPYPLYAKWMDEYKKQTGIGSNYQSIGSGGGIRQIQARTVHFGATDAALPASELDRSGLVQFPAALGAVVPVINVEGIRSGDLVLDGPTLAGI